MPEKLQCNNMALVPLSGEFGCFLKLKTKGATSQQVLVQHCSVYPHSNGSSQHAMVVVPVYHGIRTETHKDCILGLGEFGLTMTCLHLYTLKSIFILFK